MSTESEDKDVSNVTAEPQTGILPNGEDSSRSGDKYSTEPGNLPDYVKLMACSPSYTDELEPLERSAHNIFPAEDESSEGGLKKSLREVSNEKSLGRKRQIDLSPRPTEPKLKKLNTEASGANAKLLLQVNCVSVATTGLARESQVAITGLSRESQVAGTELARESKVAGTELARESQVARTGLARESQVAGTELARESKTSIETLPWDLKMEIFKRIPPQKTDDCVTVCRTWRNYFRHHQRSLRLDNPGVSFFPLSKMKFCNLVSLTLDFSLSDPPLPGQTTSTYNNRDVVQLLTDQDLATVAVDCPMLERLQLFSCYLVTATGLIPLARGCRGLEFIHLSHCRQFDDAGLFAVISACRRLKNLEISYLEVTLAGIEALSKLTTVTAYECPPSVVGDDGN